MFIINGNIINKKKKKRQERREGGEIEKRAMAEEIFQIK